MKKKRERTLEIGASAHDCIQSDSRFPGALFSRISLMSDDRWVDSLLTSCAKQSNDLQFPFPAIRIPVVVFFWSPINRHCQVHRAIKVCMCVDLKLIRVFDMIDWISYQRWIGEIG